jgi:prepilin-type processing-associated H-X9-DG protein
MCGFDFVCFGTPPYSGPASNPNTSQYWNFTSQHTGIVNFVFADGSVHSMSTSIDNNTWVSLCGMADGNVVNF